MVSAAKGALYKYRGVHSAQGNSTFRVYAPNAKSVSLCLTTAGKCERQFQMQKDSEGVWEVRCAKEKPGRTYLYFVEDCHGKKMFRTDPFSFSTKYIPKSSRVESVVVEADAYKWNDSDWMAQRASRDPLKRPLSIYEVQGKSWKTSYDRPASFKELANELIAYCQKMNYTHVELYGLLNHLTASEHGYQIAHFFAPYQPQGSADDLKYLIDKLHQAGIGVIVDWVMTHYYHQSTSNTYNATLYTFDGTDLFGSEATNWGTLYFDYTKEETRRLMQASALYWLDEMHVDGLRFDAVSEMINRDGQDKPEAMQFLKDLNSQIHESFPGVLTIAECYGNHPTITKPLAEDGFGFDLKWGIGWNRDTRNYLHKPVEERVDQENHHKMVHYMHNLPQDDKELLTHSHDDSDINLSPEHDSLYHYLAISKDEATHFANLRNFFAWQILEPSHGILLHMGDDLGQTESWYERFKRRISSVDWSCETSEKHQKLQKCVSDLNALYRKNSGLWENPRTGFQLLLDKKEECLVAYHRDSGNTKRIAVVHNFSDKEYPAFELPLPKDDPRSLQIKKISEVFNSDKPLYGGSGKFESHKVEILRSEHSDHTRLRLALAPHSTVVIEEEFDERANPGS